jgi:hypothetical protein
MSPIDTGSNAIVISRKLVVNQQHEFLPGFATARDPESIKKGRQVKRLAACEMIEWE